MHNLLYVFYFHYHTDHQKSSSILFSLWDNPPVNAKTKVFRYLSTINKVKLPPSIPQRT